MSIPTLYRAEVEARAFTSAGAYGAYIVFCVEADWALTDVAFLPKILLRRDIANHGAYFA